ncbi:MAG TPA: M1 family aminopeptidase [Bryobacteraceae bacterium]|nr:M1 family aminopeptidase [Bryobacteraceae bacterium]
MRWLLAILLGTATLAAATVADLTREIRETALDPDECYRVRDLTLGRDDLRFYFTDGYLIFTKPVAGRRLGAVFTTDVEGGDGEILLLPPTRGERRSMAAYIGSPNLSERIRTAFLLFTDDTYQALLADMRDKPFNRKVPEMGLLAAGEWGSVMRNLAASYETRLALDLLSRTPPSGGFFGAAINGRKLGNFDALDDPRSREQVLLGQVAVRNNSTYFDIWTSFEARSRRNKQAETAAEFTLRDYRIQATVEPDLNLKVTTRVKVTPRGEARYALPFEIARPMRVGSVMVDGRPAEVLQHDSMRANLVRGTGNDLFLVAPAEPLEPGREYEFEFHHEGRVIHDAGNQVFYVGARSNWYPNRHMQFATYDLTFRHPGNFDIVLPGELVGQKTEGEWRVTRRRTTRPIRFAGFNLGHYDTAKISRAGYTVEVYANQTFEEALQARPREALVVISPPVVWNPRQRRPSDLVLVPTPPPPGPRVRLHELASEVGSALEFMTARFGPPALETLAVSPVPGAFGQGFPGLLYLSTLTYLQPLDKAVTSMNARQQVFFTEILQAHETAHQWWGNVVSAAGYHDDWLMEALANYSALLYLEKRKGRRTVDMVMEEYRTNLLEKLESGGTVDSAGPVALGGRLESSQAPQAWRSIIYGKGSWIIHMLHRSMGDARFLEMLAELRRRHEWKSISTEEFRDLATRYMPPKWPDTGLAAFFDQWVYGTGIPALKLSYAVKGKGAAMRVEGTITQDEVDKDFSAAVPVEIQFARGKPLTHIVMTGPDPAPFSVRVPQAPSKVLLDPQRSVLRR